MPISQCLHRFSELENFLEKTRLSCSMFSMFREIKMYFQGLKRVKRIESNKLKTPRDPGDPWDPTNSLWNLRALVVPLI